jgi:hypothetical protein
MIVLSSFTHRLFPKALPLCESMRGNLGSAQAIIYHEDVKGDPFPRDTMAKFPWITWVNLVRADRKGLGRIDACPEFEAAKAAKNVNERYFNYHARFWARKVVANRACMRNNPQESLFLWLDADCCMNKPIMDGCLETAKKGDIGYIKRVGKPTDTGLILFNTRNPMVRAFVEEWYDLYFNRRVFKELTNWADHQAFDHVMAMPKFASLRCYDLQECQEFRGLMRHMTGHLKMAALRKRD